MNMTNQPQKISLDFSGTGVTGKQVKTLMASDGSLQAVTSAQDVTLPPFATWVAAVE
jgi:hypothetical protein